MARRNLLLSTAALMGTLTGYARGAYAQCVGGPSYQCGGLNTNTVILPIVPGTNDVSVETEDDFSVETRLLYGGGGLWAWNDIDTSRAVIFPGFFERQTANAADRLRPYVASISTRTWATRHWAFAPQPP